MARIRTIKPEFFMNDSLAELPPLDRILFIGLWTQADREGRLKDRPRKIKAAILPYDDHDIESSLNRLQEKEFIQRYSIKECNYIQINNFLKHQYPNVKEQESTIPAPCKNSTSIPRLRKGNKGKESIVQNGASLSLAELLANKILKNNPQNITLTEDKKKYTIERWAKDIEKLMRIDNRSYADIETIINWCQEDSFWKANILSGEKLREKWDQLTIKMNLNNHQKQGTLSDAYKPL